MRIPRWLALAAAVATAPALAQDAGPSKPPGPPGPGAMRRYDPATVVTISGEVVAVERVDRGRGHQGVHLSLRTGTETLAVHLGPDFWVDKQDLKVAKGDRVEVRGSRITFEGKPALIAQWVKKGDRTLTLRDEAGKPAWAGPQR